MTKSILNYQDLLQDEKRNMFMFQEYVKEFSKYMYNIYEVRQGKTFA